MKIQSETELEEKSILHNLKLNSREFLIGNNLKLSLRGGGVGCVRVKLDRLTQSKTDIGLFCHNRCSRTLEFGHNAAKE